MQYKKIIFIFLFCLIFFANKSLSKENKILVRINNEIITTIDILNEIKFLSLTNKEFRDINKNKKIEIAKNSLVRQKIKFIEISKFKKNIDLDEKVYENIVKNYFKTMKINTLEDLDFFFNKEKLNKEFVKEKISINTYWNKLIYEKFSKNVKIDKLEIKKNLIEKKKQREFLLSEIVFTVDNNENFNQKINLITKMINERNFTEAAFNYSISDTSSNGGKLGWIKEEILNNNIKNEIKEKDIGEFTKPLVIPGGFLILNIENIREIEKNIDLDKEIKIIIDKKTNDQLNQYSNIYLKKLKKNIQINEI